MGGILSSSPAGCSTSPQSRRPWRPKKGDLVDLSKLKLSDKILGGTSIVLLIDLLFFPWHHYSYGGDAARLLGIDTSYTIDFKATEHFNTFWAVLALLLVIAIIAVLVTTKFTSAKLPDLPVPLNQAIFFASIGVAALLVLKLLTKPNHLGWGAYLAIVLAGGLVYGGFLKSKEPAETTA
jgi:hypothetical protein